MLPDRQEDLDRRWLTVFTVTGHRRPDILEAQAQIPDSARVNAMLYRDRIWEPLLTLWGPTSLNSGYRSPVLNAIVGGAPKSVHQEGRAADCRPLRYSLTQAMALLALSSIPFGKAIVEFGCVHVEAPAPGVLPARSCLISFGERNPDGSWHCYPFHPDDPRLSRFV